MMNAEVPLKKKVFLPRLPLFPGLLLPLTVLIASHLPAHA